MDGTDSEHEGGRRDKKDRKDHHIDQDQLKSAWLCMEAK